ncbi:hypothetical protein LWC34_06770 [Kibdelosporangium philippinense]|uniref:Proline-rich protein n=1 Tax=Kibdelosporangium philippinense TaxID=211113 RepID=A0ABS8Z3N8_9PSEU|nr:hypothetical protein [Kibdelosporangium philippinense]MCE7002534.1 hypothetical protein [Kibdelosporangium philippinense]
MTDKPTAVRVYLARVRTSLADLPASEVEEILDDVRPHLADVELELGPDARIDAMIERLGTPESYAAELRASGGYPPASEAAKTYAASGLVRPRIALWGLVISALGCGVVAFVAAVNLEADALLALALPLPIFIASLALLLTNGVESVLALPEMKWLSETVDRAREKDGPGKVIRFLESMKPAWWVVCAAVLVAFGLMLMLRHRQAVLLLPLLAAIGVAAVWAGQRVRGDRRLLWMVVPVSMFAVGGMLGGFGATADLIGSRTSYPTATSNYYSSSDSYGTKQLTYGGNTVENIYAFDAEGEPLTDVYLYDEQGRPITLTRFGCRDTNVSREKVGEDNRFPRPQIERTEQPFTDGEGRAAGYRTKCRENKEVPFSAAIPKIPAPSATPSPTPSSQPSTPVPSSTSTSTPPASPTPTK